MYGYVYVSCVGLCVGLCQWCVVCVARLGTRKNPVCRFKTSPCVGSKRFRVCRQNARMCSVLASMRWLLCGGDGSKKKNTRSLIAKNIPREKLSPLKFYINSKTIKLQRVKSVIIFAKMVCKKLITKNVFLWSRCIPGVKRQAFVAARHGTRIWNHCRLTGNAR